MKVDPQQLLEDGYIILPQVVPPDQLDDLRASVDLLVTRHQVISASNRKPGEPPGGRMAERQTTARGNRHRGRRDYRQRIGFLPGREYAGCQPPTDARQRDNADEHTGPCAAQFADYGYTDWHRDIDAMEQTPLDGLQMDLVANAPRLCPVEYRALR